MDCQTSLLTLLMPSPNLFHLMWRCEQVKKELSQNSTFKLISALRPVRGGT